MEIPQWILNPCDDTDVSDIELQDELISIQNDEELKVEFKKGYQRLWLHETIPNSSPLLWAIAKKFLIAFPSSYLAERGFSAVANIVTKTRNRIAVTERGDLRLVSNHQRHPSH